MDLVERRPPPTGSGSKVSSGGGCAAGSSNSSNQSVASLILYTVSLIVICLTAFNFYLLVWIWSSLAARTSVTSSATKQPQIDLLSSWHEIKIKGKLASRRHFKANSIEANNEQDSISISSRLNSSSSPSIRLLTSRRENLIELSNGIIQLENGLRLVGLAAGSEVGREAAALVCLPAAGRAEPSGCQVRERLQTVRLTWARGVDFRRKSVQTARVRTKRLHSALNELHLMSANGASGSNATTTTTTTTGCSFKSLNGTIKLTSMDDLVLLSKRANVIIDVRTINVSLALSGGAAKRRSSAPERNERDRGRPGYRLCICLPPLSETSPNNNGENNNDNNSNDNSHRKEPLSRPLAGRLFAVRASLKCDRFSSFCQTTTTATATMQPLG